MAIGHWLFAERWLLAIGYRLFAERWLLAIRAVLAIRHAVLCFNRDEQNTL